MKMIWAGIKQKFASCRNYIDHATEIVVALISGLMAFTQLFDGDDDLLPADSFTFLTPEQAAHLLGGLFAVAFVLMLVGAMFRTEDFSRTFRRVGSFIAFLCFSYVTFIGFFSDSLTDPVGVLAFGMALLSGFLHIKENRVVNDV